MQIRLAAPTDDEDAWDAVDLLVQEREQGIDDVAEPAVLEVDERRFARREVIARRERRRIPLVRGNDMRGAARSIRIHEIVHKRAQLRVGHACEKFRAECGNQIIDVHRCSLSAPNHCGRAARIAGQNSPLFAISRTISRARG